MNFCGTTVVCLAILFASVAFSEDFKTTTGKVYKDATVSRVESDGIELKTKTGIFKVYFAELPREVQERFHWTPPQPAPEPFYSRWATAAEDPTILAKFVAAACVVIVSTVLVIRYIRSRRQPMTRVTRPSRRKVVDRSR